MARPIRRLILWAGGSLLALILLVCGALAVLVFGVDADRYRPRIEALASAQLGREVRLGRLEWDVGARLQLASLGGSVANAPGFGGASLASWERVAFGLALRPLLDRQVRIDHVVIDGLDLDLQRNAAGETNWALPEKPADSRQTDTTIAIEGLSLRSARARYRDAGSAADWQIEQLALDVSLPGGSLERLEALQNLAAAGRLSGGGLVSEGVEFSFGADAVRFDRAQLSVSLPAFRARVDRSTLEGRFEGQGGSAPLAKAALKLTVPALRAQLGRFGIPVAPMRDPAALGGFSIEAELAYADGAVMLDPLALTLDETHLAGSASLPTLAPLSLRFALDADTIDLDRYLEPPEVEGEPLVLPVEKLKALDAKGRLRIAAARVAGADATNVEITVE